MFFSLELNENSQTVKKSLEQRLRQLLYIFEGQRKRRLKTLGAFILDLLPKASLGEIAWFGLALPQGRI